jgi:EAL domain-containing protein (putative c-di-GMP-specific phosphodiesterase class I)
VVDARAGGRVTGVEALVRWQHPERGLLGPGAFMAIAEQSGLVVELGRFVLSEASRRLAAWREEGVVDGRFSMAVNVSGRQLADPGFVDDVAAILRATGLDRTPRVVGLEITETILMDDAMPSRVLGDLAALGVELLLDDFGTGASSLARLKRFPVHTLKIDRAFVSGLGGDDVADDAIVTAIMSLAGALGLRVIAEGVETCAQLERLRDLECGRIQGFLYSKPLPARELRALLEHGRGAADGAAPRSTVDLV